MKKNIITLLFIIPLLTGCVSINSNLTINKDKSANFDLQIISDEHAKPQELVTMKSNFNKFLDKTGYSIQNMSSPDNVKILASKSVNNLLKEDLDLNSLGFTTNLPSGRFIDVKNNFFITLYRIDMIYNIKDQQNKIQYTTDVDEPANDGLKPEYLLKYADISDINEDDISKSDFMKNIDPNVIISKIDKSPKEKSDNANNKGDEYKLFDMEGLNAKFSVSLPSAASSNNAHIVNGCAYTWKLNKTAPTEIRLLYIVYNGVAISFILLLGISLIIYLAYRIHRHDLLKRIGNNN